MKSLIVFGSRYGTTEICANKLKEYLNGEVEIVNIDKNDNIILEKYENIIIGSPVYAGSFNKKIKEFIENNKIELTKKRLGLFMCCMSQGEKIKEQFEQNVPKDILKVASVKVNFGGEFKFSKMNFFEKKIIKIIAKKDRSLGEVDGKSDIYNINEDAIKSFAKSMGV
ncbi:MAG: flavodoxin domain-containing protein [Terrisporobacter sp.]|uniref:flavodoxin domain-containing protein n=1 Tax=Terrisporobacter sp. TaxID=1965305 RepID=UPI002FC8543A